jgi:hypothetical protein
MDCCDDEPDGCCEQVVHRSLVLARCGARRYAFAAWAMR